MKKSFLIALLLLITITNYSQTKDIFSKFNFDFESIEKNNPSGWINNGNTNYKFSLDSVIVKSGKYSVSIEFKEGKSSFGTWSYAILNNYLGHKITLSGYIKTQNITDGFAGLWMSIDSTIGSKNIQKNGIIGTTEWKKYEITLIMNPAKTKQILIGGILTGKGKMWLDKLSVTIDGYSIKYSETYPRNYFTTNKDREFDNGSEINNIPINKNQIENLKILGLIWGFLKYYHPNIAKGEYNWDYELFRILPKILNSENIKKRDEILVNWISKYDRSLDTGNTGTSPEPPNYSFDQSLLNRYPQGLDEESIPSELKEIKFQPDLKWIKNSGFSNELSILLLKVKNTKRTGKNYYYELNYPGHKNENPYISMKYPDVGFRLLSLYRYWNIIQYFFPYKNIIGENWENVLEEFIPKVINVKNETEYLFVISELVARIHDSHAIILEYGHNEWNPFGANQPAVVLKFIENKAVVTGYCNNKSYKETGLKIGDIITNINNRPVEKIIKERLKYVPGSNYTFQLGWIAFDLLKTDDSEIKIEFVRDGKKEKSILKTFPADSIDFTNNYQNNDTCFKLINKDIAYINYRTLKKVYLPQIWRNIKNTKGLIIDIRNYPSENDIVNNFGNYLMPERLPFAKWLDGNIENPGLFTFNQTYYVGKKNRRYYKGKIIILINEVTISQSELDAMAYSLHPNAIIIGSTTAGAGGGVREFYLPGGIYTQYSGCGFYYPDGREIERVGIIPEIFIKPTIAGIKKKQDEILEKAIKIINVYNKKQHLNLFLILGLSFISIIIVLKILLSYFFINSTIYCKKIFTIYNYVKP